MLGGVEWVSNSVRVVDGEARGEDGLKDEQERPVVALIERSMHGKVISPSNLVWAHLRSAAAVLCLSAEAR